jgi:transposase
MPSEPIKKKAAPPPRYPDEMRERAVRMVRDLKAADPSDRGVFSRVSRQLGVGSQSLRLWVAQAETRDGLRPQVSESEASELKELRKEVKELRRANDILRAAATFFGAELDRQPKR